MKKLNTALSVIVFCALAGMAGAVTPPVITQPKPGIVRFTWTIPTVRTDNSPIAATEVKECRLYLTNEANYIAVQAPTAAYTYIVPLGYTTTAADSAVATCVDADGRLSPLSNVAALPIGVTSPKSLISAPGGLTAVRAP